jgi:hypothetical protein
MKISKILNAKDKSSLPSGYLWKYGKSKVRVLDFDSFFVILESKTGKVYKKSRFHCGVHLRNIC